MRAPASGFWGPNSRRIAIKPGISCSAILISLRPQSASDRSATLNFGELVSIITGSVSLISRKGEDLAC